jgi:hypothetical protein
MRHADRPPLAPAEPEDRPMRRTPPARSFSGVALAAAVLVSGAAGPARADDGEAVFQRALKSTVYIRFQVPGGGYRSTTGALIDAKKRYVLTSTGAVGRDDSCFALFPIFENDRLVVKRARYHEIMANRGAIKGKLIASDRNRGLALVELERLAEGVAPLKLAEKSPPPGTTVHTIGNPVASDALWSYTSGQVRQRAYFRKIPRGDDVLALNILETTTAVNLGDTGGPLISDKGELVGASLGELAGANSVSIFADISAIRQMLNSRLIHITGEAKPVSTEKDPKLLKNVESALKKTAPKDEDPAEEKASAADENKAAGLLAVAQSLAERGSKERAMQYLQDLVKKYPNTAASREGRDLIKQLKKK